MFGSYYQLQYHAFREVPLRSIDASVQKHRPLTAAGG